MNYSGFSFSFYTQHLMRTSQHKPRIKSLLLFEVLIKYNSREFLRIFPFINQDKKVTSSDKNSPTPEDYVKVKYICLQLKIFRYIKDIYVYL